MALIALTVFFRTEMHRDSIDDAGVYAGVGLFRSPIRRCFPDCRYSELKRL